jgi:hypothetical protein
MRHVLIEFLGLKITIFPLFTFFPHFPSLLPSHLYCPTSVLCTSCALLLLLSSVLSLFLRRLQLSMMKDTESVMRTAAKKPVLTALNAGTDPSAPSSSSSV